jgi:hypothetical protein
MQQPTLLLFTAAAALHRVLREELLQDWNPSTMDADPLPA